MALTAQNPVSRLSICKQRNRIANVFSFVQIRGSGMWFTLKGRYDDLASKVPLYWTQSGYSMKPPPVLSPECTSEQNSDAMKRHFQRTIAIYGPHASSLCLLI